MPAQGTGETELAQSPPEAGQPIDSARPVPFDRLLSVAVLTPAQAAFVAVHLLDAAQTSGTSGTSDCMVDQQGPARLGAVTLMPSGGVHVSPPQADDGAEVTDLLKQLLENARRLPAHPRPEQLQLLHRLEAAAEEPLREPGARACQLEGALADALGPTARRRLSEQLGRLVDAFAHVAPSVPRPIGALPDPRPEEPSAEASAVRRAASTDRGYSGSAPHRARPPRHPSGPSRGRSRALPGRRPQGRRVAVFVLVLAVVVVGIGYLALRGSGTGVFASLGRDSGTAPAATAPDRTSQRQGERLRPSGQRAVPVLAGRHAGPITRVAVGTTGSCRPGTVCPVKVTVHLRPSASSRQVGWKVGAVRLCKRDIVWSAPTSVTAQPGWTTVRAHSSVRVPKRRPLALIALTTTPARAQSRPVPVTGSSLRC